MLNRHIALQNEMRFVTAQKRRDSKVISDTITHCIIVNKRELEPCRFVLARQKAFVETIELA
jgi:hypothetical protein